MSTLQIERFFALAPVSKWPLCADNAAGLQHTDFYRPRRLDSRPLRSCRLLFVAGDEVLCVLLEDAQPDFRSISDYYWYGDGEFLPSASLLGKRIWTSSARFLRLDL